MKPHRVRMAHNLIVNYNLYKEMDIFRPPLVDHTELTRFHSDDYINFLRSVSPDNMHDHMRQLQRCKILSSTWRPVSSIHYTSSECFLRDVSSLFTF